MGSDLYVVNVSTYREHTTEEARRRLVAHGYPPDNSFFSGEGPWIEIRLDVECVHPDAPISWDPLMVIRWLDEAVYRSARTDGSGFDYEKTPLFRRYPGLWKMEMNLEKEEDAVVRVVEVEHRKNPTPREGNPKDPYGDTATIAAFVHKKYAPNVAEYGSWESRAWGGGGWFWRDYPVARRPILAEIRSVSPSVSVPSKKHQEVTAITPRREGGLWAATSAELAAVTVDGSTGKARVEPVLNIAEKHRLSGVTHLAAAADGALWMATQKAVVRRGADGNTAVFHCGKELAGKKVLSLDVSPEGQVFVGADNGLHWLEPGGAWGHVEDGLAERAVRGVTALPGGVAWTVGHKHLTRRNADGSLERFQARQGIEYAQRTAALPGGALWVLSWSRPAMYVPPGAGRAVPDEMAPSVAPGGVRLAATGQDGAVWAVTQRGYLLRLREGEAPKVYVWEGDEQSLWNNVREIEVSPEGDVWLLMGNGDLRCVRASDIAAAGAAPPLNADMPHLARTTPVFFGPAPRQKVETAAEAASAASAAKKEGVDLKGKTVVITGTLSKLTRAEAQRVLSERGALLSDSVNKKTDYLIVGLKPSSKLQKAKSLGIPVLDEDVLL
jgi:hypothetical protein